MALLLVSWRFMRSAWIPPAVPGVVVGAALSAFARSANGFLVGPPWAFFMLLVTLVAVIGVVLLMWKRRRRLGMQLIVFALTVVAVQYLLVIVWPFPPDDSPVPLGEVTG